MKPKHRILVEDSDGNKVEYIYRNVFPEFYQGEHVGYKCAYQKRMHSLLTYGTYNGILLFRLIIP